MLRELSLNEMEMVSGGHEPVAERRERERREEAERLAREQAQADSVEQSLQDGTMIPSYANVTINPDYDIQNHHPLDFNQNYSLTDEAAAALAAAALVAGSGPVAGAIAVAALVNAYAGG